jgi:hypothetical protein
MKIYFVVEQLGIVHGLVYQKQSNGKENDAGEPDAQEGSHDFLFDKFFSEHVQEMEYQEEYDRHYQRHAKSPFPDDGTQRCANEEKHNASKGQ